MAGNLAMIVSGGAVALLIFWLVTRTVKARTYFLLLLSAILVVTIQAVYIGLPSAIATTLGLFVLSLLVFTIGPMLRNSGRPLWLFPAIFMALLPLLTFRYIIPYHTTFWVPLGISYYTFKHIHYLIESSRGKFADALLSDYLCYIYFFPMFMAGPLERFGPFQAQIASISFSWNNFSLSCERILMGAIKKFFFADIILRSLMLPEHLFQLHQDSMAWHLLLFNCTMKWLVTYCDFAGYTDMALGTAGLFGIRLCENFNFPMLRSNLAEFWRSWHMSLASWARDYVYFPILGRFRATSLALVATMVTIGAWHSLHPGWLFWGLHHGLGLVLLSKYHRWASKRSWLQKLRNTLAWKMLGMMAVWYHVSLAYALTYIPDNLALGLNVYLQIISFGVLP